ncbi:MAG: hypothetical protein AAGI52_18005 [Bacteroidota bacterium]
MTRVLPLFLVLALPLSACGGGDDASSDEVEETGAPSTPFGQAMQGMEAIQDMAEQVEEMQNTVPAEPVNHRVLAEMLPDEAAGMPQGETSGSTNSTMGFSLSEREATYADSTGDGQITIKVIDYGAVPAIGMMGLGWVQGMDIDEESSTGYKRTITYQGHRGLREYNTERRDGTLNVFIVDRYIVEVSGRNVEDDQLEAALQGVDTRRLAEMRDEGRPAS